MKNLLLVLFIATGFIANAQPLTRADIVGTYEVSKLYLNDTLFYDKSNPEKSDKNVLIEIGKQIPSFVTKEDSTLALALFYKDINKALGTIIHFYEDSTTQAICNGGIDTTRSWPMTMRFVYIEKWGFNDKKQMVNIMRNGKVTERMPVKKVNGVVTLFIDDKKEKTKLELVKMY